MSELANWRIKGFRVGWVLFALSWIALFVAGVREPHWMYCKSFHEGSIWIYGGLAVALMCALLVLCGKGWKRVVLEFLALIELYLWFSWLTFAVQMR